MGIYLCEDMHLVICDLMWLNSLLSVIDTNNMVCIMCFWREYLLLKVLISVCFPFQMAMLPEGITELLQHEMLPVPLVCVTAAIFCSVSNYM